VVVRPPGHPAYRDFTVFPHDSDGDLGTHAMPYRHQVLGVQAMSYRQGQQVLEAYPSDPVRMHVVAAVSEQVQGFALDGHRWPLEPSAHGTNVVAAEAIGGRESFTIEPLGGAGGEQHLPGDFLFGDTRAPYRDAGEWGVLRVLPSRAPDLASLSGDSHRALFALLGSAVIGALVLVHAGRSRRRRLVGRRVERSRAAA